jgi:hypothetical protein
LKLCVSPIISNFPFETFEVLKNVIVGRSLTNYLQPFSTNNKENFGKGLIIVGEEADLTETFY